MALDPVTTGEPVEVAAQHLINVERNEPEASDPVGAALAGALQSWCGARDPRSLRRSLLRLLAELEDE